LLNRITEHDIDRARVSEKAVAVIDKLRTAGFDAYLVGGCVRDLLLGKLPKDFDVATDATPEDVGTVFARSRLIGRRFRIAHVRMGREVIEVSTFRRAMAHAANGNGSSASIGEEGPPLLSEQGMILRDNAYGSIDEDAFRRDFTVNALYYDPVAHVILDYCGGLGDIETRTLRLIGDPEGRFREDPVRLLRAVRFVAKLGEGYDLVTGWKKHRRDPLIKVISSRLFNFAARLSTGLRLHDINCGFKAMRGEAARSLRIHGELHRLIPVLAAARGFRVTEIEVTHHPRRHGRSKYGIERMFRGLFDLITVVLATRLLKRPAQRFVWVDLAFLALALLLLGGLIVQGSGTPPLVAAGAVLILARFVFRAAGRAAERVAATEAPDQEFPGYAIQERLD
jgi:hypothetical protein